MIESLEVRLCPSTLIDARALTMPNITLDSSINISTAAVYSANLAAGTHTLLYGNGVGPADIVAFNVDNSGAVSYDSSLNGVLSGQGSSTLLVNGRTVQIDATALTMPDLSFNFSVNCVTAKPFKVTVLPGAQSLLHGNGVGPSDIVAFSVDNSGAVSYDSSLNGVLSGQGSSTLVVNGRTVQIDASALTMPDLSLNFSVNCLTATPFKVTVLPGAQSLLHGNGVGPADIVAFSVDNSGAVSYDSSLNGVLSGQGSSTLLVNGRTVQIDATALTMPDLSLNFSVNCVTATPFKVTVLPGVQSLLHGNGVGPSDIVAFSVDNSGAVDYDPSLNGVLSGRASSTLVVHGVTVQIDATALTMPDLSLNFTVNCVTATPFKVTVLPGVQSLLYGNGVGPSDIVAFSVDNSGAVDYDPSLNGVLSGRASSNLVVHGVTVQIDANALTMPDLSLNFTVNVATATPFTATLLPGVQSLLYGNGVGPSDIVAFSVDNSGAVSYDSSLNGVLSGRGSSTLVVNGVTIHIDARGLTTPNLLLNYTVNFATACPFSATLLPGVQSLLPVNCGPVAFSVNNSDAVDYDASLNGVLSGRGTSTLVVGTPITTTTTVASSLGTSVLGQSVTFTATVVPADSCGGGTVTFLLDGSTPLGTVALNGSGQAMITTAALPAGTHTITASFTGDGAFLASTSAALTQTVLSAQQEIALLCNQVDALVNSGVLNSGNGNALCVKLNAAINSLNAIPPNITAAVNQLNAFNNQVTVFQKTEKLTSAQAQTLVSVGNLAIIAANGGSGAHLMNQDASGSSASTDTQPVCDAGQLVTGTIDVYLDNADGTAVPTDEQARFDDAIHTLDATFAPYGVNVLDVGVGDAGDAIVQVEIAATSAAGNAADGVLGCTVAGKITLVTGWNWYTGADPGAIGADQYDFETIVAHELGHAIGLGHSGDNDSVMYPYLGSGQARRGVTTQDMSVLEAWDGAPEPLLAARARLGKAALSREAGSPAIAILNSLFETATPVGASVGSFPSVIPSKPTQNLEAWFSLGQIKDGANTASLGDALHTANAAPTSTRAVDNVLGRGDWQFDTATDNEVLAAIR
jgi:hypothetical protein